MTENNCRIICASAGTGKTYRLSVEYLSLILKYYSKNEFALDNILVLTFTRKATAEIRDRIIKHLELLVSEPETEEEQKKQQELLLNLRKLNKTKELTSNTKPMTALVILLRAFSTLVLSPPEVIHSKAPSKKKAITASEPSVIDARHK